MRKVTIFLMALALALAVTTTTAAPVRGRFLASMNPKGKKCDMDPRVCLTAGSGGPNCCGQQCVDSSTDVFNCGKCGKVCKFTDACCDGKCVDLRYDKRHCGHCNNKCQKGVRCVYGACGYA